MCAKVFLQLQIVAIIILAAVCDVSCVSDMHWTRAGECLVWSSGQDSLEWEGNLFEGVAHGSGKIVTVNEKGTQNAKDVSAFYGALNPDDIVEVDNGGKFVGKTDDNKMVGFGVLVQGKDLFIGDFENSKPNGYLKWYKNDSLYYDGHWQAGTFHGEGTLYKEDGSVKAGTWNNGKLIQTFCKASTSLGVYEGYILNDMPDGQGTMTYKNGFSYVGLWAKGKWSGKGIYTSDTDTISGEWSNGLLNGEAICRTSEYIYNGEFSENKPSGIGNFSLRDSLKYKGSWIDGKMYGYGILCLPNGDNYIGNLVNNEFEGVGTYFYNSGDTYEGEWNEGLQHGYGLYRSKSFEYIGNWDSGWINGEGKVTYPNSDSYEGCFVENEIHGKGRYAFHNGNVYEGEFVDGKFNGLGTFYFADGNIFQGEFHNGKIHGDGTLYVKTGESFISITAFWNGNKMLSEASVLFSNGDLYEGELIEGVPTNKGKWTSEKERTSKNAAVIAKSLNNANDSYKKHKKEIDEAVYKVSKFLTAVELVAPVAGDILCLVPYCQIAGRGLKLVGKSAHYANVALNVVDAGANIASAGLDTHNDINEGKDPTISAVKLGSHVAINAAFVFGPKMLKKKPAKKVVAKLGPVAKGSLKKSFVQLNKNKVFAKIYNIVKDKAGNYERKAANSTCANMMKVVARKASFKSKFLAHKIAKSLLQKELNAIRTKGAIELTKKELDYLLKNPKALRSFIKSKGGGNKNFQEFFIRLAMSENGKAAIKEIMANPEIRRYVDRAIRNGGGKHEWLMAKNFTDFLTNPKWGADGQFLALALTKLVQNTERVIFKYGGKHGSTNSGSFHNGLARVIDNCSTKEELFLEIKKYAKQHLSKESYAEFVQIFANTFKPA